MITIKVNIRTRKLNNAFFEMVTENGYFEKHSMGIRTNDLLSCNMVYVIYVVSVANLILP